MWMDSIDISFRFVILLQLNIGVLVNIFLLLFYVNLVSTNHNLSSSDLIHAHIILVNILILFTCGIPQTMSVWGLKHFLNYVACKIFIYLYRVVRGISICTICLLSIFQAITISPNTSWWVGLKAKLPGFIISSCLLFWILNMLINVGAPVYLRSPQNTSVPKAHDIKYGLIATVSTETALITAVVFSGWDLFFVGLMSVANSYMVLALYRHQRRVQHLHRPSHSPRVIPEVRAAKIVIVLVILYVLFYGRQSIMLSVLLNREENSPLLWMSHVVWSFSFSVLSPFLIFYSDRRMRKFWKKEFPFSNIALS